MKATAAEFKHRALIFGLIFGIPFALYSVDPQNSVALLASAIEARTHELPVETIARILFLVAAFIMAAAALLRTWASSYLNASVVYASEVKSASLVAEGPYRYVRNPLYLANVLMAVAFGAMMCRSGFFISLVVLPLFCYRLIFREEAELLAAQGETYQRYRQAVPRLWPSLQPRVAASARPPDWKSGFKAESWYWGFAVGILAFAITLQLPWFFGIIGVSVAFFWITSTIEEKKRR